MTKPNRKLSLNRETLVTMTDSEVAQVQGASASLVVASAVVATQRVCPAVTARVCPKVVNAAKDAFKVSAGGVLGNRVDNYLFGDKK
ncbi:MAG: class I lanthipeptide [Myxococcota bacterium]|nr:class I lanthipeptide [Myxococcota bacterium]